MGIEWLPAGKQQTKQCAQDGREVFVSSGSSDATVEHATGESEFARFAELAGKLVQVSKSELDEQRQRDG